MFARNLVIFLVFIYTLLSGITWVSGDAGNSVSGRFIAADFVGLAIIGCFFLDAIRNKYFYYDRSFTIYLIFLFFNLISLTFSSYPDKGVVEYLTHVFIFLVTISLYNMVLYRKGDIFYIRTLFEASLLASGLIALVGILQFFFFPSLFSNSFGGLSGTFRNTGQAGAYFSIFLSLGIAGLISNFIRRNLLNLSSIVLLLTALIFTFKRAAIIGMSVGLLLLLIKLAISRRSDDKKYFLIFLSVIFGFSFIFLNIFLWAGENIEGVVWRSTSKFNENTIEDFSEGFLAENIAATMHAFWDSPIIGVGMGNMAGIYTAKYEIHSTYMSILSASGLLGIILYLSYIFTIYKKFLRLGNYPVINQFLINTSILFLGLLVSWSYTYHIRKREFWIFITLILIVSAYNKMKQRCDSNFHTPEYKD